MGPIEEQPVDDLDAVCRFCGKQLLVGRGKCIGQVQQYGVTVVKAQRTVAQCWHSVLRIDLYTFNRI